MESDSKTTDRPTDNPTTNGGPDTNSAHNAMPVSVFPPEDEQYECQICKELFFSESLYALHMKSHGEKKEVMRKHICTQCFTSFRRKSHLDQHLQTHTDLKEYECKLCERQYKRKGELMRHLKTHTGRVYL